MESRQSRTRGSKGLEVRCGELIPDVVLIGVRTNKQPTAREVERVDKT